jgi:Fe(3+) dicitrate transport protein
MCLNLINQSALMMRISRLLRGKPFILAVLTTGLATHHAAAQTLAIPLAAPEAGVERLDTVQVVAALQPPEDGPFLPEVEGAQIFAGKKTDNIDPNLLPQINNNNYRQVLATTPGVVLAEESTPLVSIGSRGFDPHRMQFLQVLKDGIPIHADMIGYPEAYYTPPIDAVDRIELVRGGAALLYGPQPGGALNYVMEKPPTDTPFRVRSLNTIGSFNYYASFSEIGGTIGDLGYYGYYNHRQTDGFRAANSEFNLNSWSGTVSWGQQTTARTYLIIDAYDETHGEPGGVTLASGPNTVNWNSDPYGTTRFYDNMRISRYAVQLIHENDLSDTTFFSVRGWWNYYLRYSARQRGGGFGTLPTGPDALTNQIENQQFYTFGFEPRLRQDWEWLGNTHTLTGGMLLFNTFSPRTDQRGSTPSATTGVTRNQSNRSNWYYSVFAENRFAFGNLSIVPAVRLESIWQSVDETINVAKTADGEALADESNNAFVPLFALGAQYDFTPQVNAYANVSQAYRPAVFTQAVPTSPNVFVPGNLQPSFVWNYEAGFRGSPRPWLTWDTSFFLIDFQNQIGTQVIGNNTFIVNTGRSVTYGWDSMVQMDFVGVADALRDTADGQASWVDTYGSVLGYFGLTAQQGRYIGGQFEGKTPQYTPDYLIRTGALYNWRDKIQLGLTSTFNGGAYANDNNTQQYYIPYYNVWDFTFEVNVYKDNVSVIGGINNLFDNRYYARIRNDGIDPAAPRNWYVGVQVEF